MPNTIRRADLLAPHAGPMTGAEWAAAMVKRGEAIRIQGLGTLKQLWQRVSGAEAEAVRANIGGTCPRTGDLLKAVYRLTLTTAMAHTCTNAGAGLVGVAAIASDVRRLARALGAPVEVYAPGRAAYGSTATGRAHTLLTTVSP